MSGEERGVAAGGLLPCEDMTGETGVVCAATPSPVCVLGNSCAAMLVCTPGLGRSLRDQIFFFC